MFQKKVFFTNSIVFDVMTLTKLWYQFYKNITRCFYLNINLPLLYDLKNKKKYIKNIYMCTRKEDFYNIYSYDTLSLIHVYTRECLLYEILYGLHLICR